MGLAKISLPGSAGRLSTVAILTCLLLPTDCAHYCPESVVGPVALESDPPRPCGPIEACVFPFWLGASGTAHAASPATPLGDRPSRHTGWAPGEVQEWRELSQVARALLQNDAGFVRDLAEAESQVRHQFERETARLRGRCKQLPSKHHLLRLGQSITEKIYERAGIYRRLREHHSEANPGLI